MIMLRAWIACFLIAYLGLSASGDIVGFEALSQYSQGSGGKYYNGDLGDNTPNTQGWTSEGVHFSNSFTYDSTFDYSYWSGFAYSRETNGTLAGFGNQYASRPGSGSQNSSQYAVVFNSLPGDAIVTFGAAVQVQSVDISNTAYAYYSMLNGDQFAKKFGGDTGNDPDFLKLSILGYRDGNAVGSVNFYLADYRFDDNAKDYIVSDWKTVGLTSLGAIDSLQFAMESSDNSPFGMNTPSYFAMDQIAFSSVPEPGTVALLLSLGPLLLAKKWRQRRSKATSK
jgi:hypothetical protein